jgi:hypothetical protein
VTLAYKSVIDRDKWLARHPGDSETVWPFAVGDIVENSPRGGFYAWPTLAAVPLSWFDEDWRRIIEIEYDEADKLRANYNAYVRVSRLRVVREVSREEHPKAAW